MKKVLILTSYMSGTGGVEKVISRMSDLSSILDAEFKIISLTDGVYTTNNGARKFLPIKKVDWMNTNAIYLRLDFKNKKANFAAHSLYMAFYLFKNEFDFIFATGPAQVIYLKKIRSMFNLKFKVFSWPHFSLSSGFGDFSKCNEADKILCISKDIRLQMIEIGIDKSKLVYFPNPFDKIERVFDNKHEHGCVSFIYIGRFQFYGQKRLKDLIDATKLLKGDFKVTMIGDGVDYEKIIDYIKINNLQESFEIHRGWFNNPWDLVNNPSALILTSEFEGLPTVLGEALSQGVPCISSDCETGPRDFIIDGENGFLYETKNITELSNIMQDFIDNNIEIDSSSIKSSINHLYVEGYTARFNNLLDGI